MKLISIDFLQVKDAAHTVSETLPSTTTIKKNLTNAKEQVEHAAQTVKQTVLESAPLAPGRSGEPTNKIGDPVFIEEAGEIAVPPPLPQDKYKQ